MNLPSTASPGLRKAAAHALLATLLAFTATACQQTSDQARPPSTLPPPAVDEQPPETPATPHYTGQGPGPGAPLMPLDEVEVGMQGYGVTVFSGAKRQAFPVEVISVVDRASPRGSVIWVESPDPRLRESGPVQGMSGSPIYLWEPGQEQEPGEGGRLAGAFAYGYTMVKRPLIGVQPAEYMLEVGQRIDAVEQQARQRRARPHAAANAVAHLSNLAEAQNLPPSTQLMLRTAQATLQAMDISPAESSQRPTITGPLEADGQHDAQARPLLLPMNVGSPATAQVLGPIMRQAGIAAVAGSGAAGRAPRGMPVDDVQLEPGSVISVPLLSGDVDAAASGTVTDVLDDGTILALGHAMFGDGPVAMPMATGFVHFIVPRLNVSFKRSGSLDIVGTLLQDEMAAVAGRSEQRYDMSPMNVSVSIPGHDTQHYSYQITHHPDLTPAIIAMAAAESLAAYQDLPYESTLYLDGQVSFRNGQTIDMRTILPSASPFAVSVELVPTVGLLMQNPFQSLKLDSVELNLRVEPELRHATLRDARLDRSVVEPGEQLSLTAWARPYEGALQQYRAHIQIPPDLPEGDYRMTVSGAAGYFAELSRARPHLFQAESVDDLAALVQRTYDIRRDALYVTIELPEEGIALGRSELERLPSSRRAMLVTPTSTRARPYNQMAETMLETDYVIEGSQTFTLHVRRERR